MEIREEGDGTAWIGDWHVEVGSPTYKRLVAELGDAEGESTGPPAEEKPLKRMNKTELRAKATEVGAEFDEETTNAQLVAAIEAKQSK